MKVAIVRLFVGSMMLIAVLFALGLIEPDLLLALLGVDFCLTPCALVVCRLFDGLPRIEVL